MGIERAGNALARAHFRLKSLALRFLNFHWKESFARSRACCDIADILPIHALPY